MSGPPGDIEVLFVDTNAFIQVRDLKDIPWRDLFPGATAVDLMVADAVIGELDQHKVSTNERRRTRARLALQLIDKASLEPERALTLKDAPVRVRLVVSTGARIDWSAYTNLDPASPDHRLVAEALSFGGRAAVFSHDTVPRIRARAEGIKAYKPAEDWLLPSEQTDEQRRIKQLEREARETRPTIIAAFGTFDNATSEIQLVRPILQPLAPEIATNLASEYLQQHPRATLRVSSPTDALAGVNIWDVSSYDADRYHEEYSSFANAVRGFYSNLHDHVLRMSAAAPISYQVKNDSGIAAQGLRIEFDLEGDGYLLANREDAARFVGLQRPTAPKRPRSRADLMMPNSIPMRASPEPRDPLEFYWVARLEDREHKHGAIQCEDFRSRRNYSDNILVVTGEDSSKRLNLSLHVDATNLRDPVKISATLVIEEKAVDWSDAAVQAILPKQLWNSITGRIE